MTTTKTTLSKAQIAACKQIGIEFAQNEAELWADQNNELNSERPRQMPEWTFGTYEGSFESVFPDGFSEQDREDGTFDELTRQAEDVMDRAAKRRWSEIAEQFNAGHADRVQAWEENQ